MAQVDARLASQNPNKLAELREALRGWAVEPLESEDWPEETGATYADNALLKARHGRAVAGAGVWVLGEDSGIEAQALGGGPGLHSARWAAGRDQADALLERLAGERERGARMVAELVAIAPGGDVFHGRGVLEGSIADARRGTAGFGYDPIFVPAGEKQTVAELGEDWKRQHSHRARAARALLGAIGRDAASAPLQDTR